MQSVWIIVVMLNAALLGWRHCTCLTMDGLLRVYSILFRYLFLCSRYLWFYSVMLDAKIPKNVIVRYCHVFRMENTKYNLLQRRQPWTFYYEFVDMVYMPCNIPRGYQNKNNFDIFSERVTILEKFNFSFYIINN